MKKIFIVLILTFLSFNAFGKENLKFFGISLGKTVSPGNNLIPLKSESIGDTTLGLTNGYYVENMNNISDEFHRYNLYTISLDKEFIKVLNNRYKDRSKLGSEFIFQIKAEGKELLAYEKCEIKRKALYRNLKKKYENSGYRVSFGRKFTGEILNEPREILEIYHSQDIREDTYSQKDYYIWSVCASNDGGGILRPNGDRRERFDKDKSFLNFITQKDKSKVQFFIVLRIEAIFKKEILKELYRRYQSGSFTNFSLQGF